MKAIILSETVGAGAGAFKDGVKSIIGEGKVTRFTKKEKNELGKEIVDFIKSMKKGDINNPLDKDTVFFTTHSRPAIKSPTGEIIIPAERVLEIDKVVSPGAGYGATVSTNPLVLENGHVCSHPMTLDGLKNAIKEVMEAAKNGSAEI